MKGIDSKAQSAAAKKWWMNAIDLQHDALHSISYIQPRQHIQIEDCHFKASNRSLLYHCIYPLHSHWLQNEAVCGGSKLNTWAVAGRARRPLSILTSNSSKLSLSSWVSGSISANGVCDFPFGEMPTLSTVDFTMPPHRFGPYFLQSSLMSFTTLGPTYSCIHIFAGEYCRQTCLYTVNMICKDCMVNLLPCWA